MRTLGLTFTFFLLLVSSAFAEGIVVKNTDTTKWPEVLITADLPDTPPQPEAYTLQILPDGAVVPASAIKPGDIPIPKTSIIVALDTSGSLKKGQLAAVKESLLNYIGLMAPGEQLALLSFNDKVSLEAGFKADRTRFKSVLDKLTTGGRSTELYKAMTDSIDLLKTVPGQRVLLVISDGKNEGSGISKDQVAQKAKAEGIKILSIGIPTTDKDSNIHLGYMEDFAKESGGLYRLARTDAQVRVATHEQLMGLRKASIAEKNKRFILQFNMNTPALAVSTPATLTRKAGTITESIPVKLPAVKGAKPADKLDQPDDKLDQPAEEGLEASQEKPSDAPWQNKWLWVAAFGMIFVVIGGVLATRSKKNQDTRSAVPTVYPAQSYDAGGFTPPASAPVTVKHSPTTKAASATFILEFSAQGLSYTLTEGTMTLGAKSGNDIRLNDPTVSGTHAQFFISGQECMVSDLNSTNGIVVNGERITRKMALKAGDTLVFGKMEAVLRYLQRAGHLA